MEEVHNVSKILCSKCIGLLNIYKMVDLVSQDTKNNVAQNQCYENKCSESEPFRRIAESPR